jgi:hypothetical protein
MDTYALPGKGARPGCLACACSSERQICFTSTIYTCCTSCKALPAFSCIVLGLLATENIGVPEVCFVYTLKSDVKHLEC